MEHTREHLLRIADIREELAKQLQRLERQAKAAEQYNKLKAEERVCKADILALKWNDLIQQRILLQKQLEHLQLQSTQKQSEQTHLDVSRTKLKLKVQEINELCQRTSEQFYQ